MIPRLLLVTAVLLTPTLAHAGDLTVTRSGGQIGGLLTYDIQGDPSETFFLVPSISQGPLPVALFCPGDPRVIEVGTELQSLGTLGVLSPTGQAQVLYPMPPSPSFQGVPVFAQCMTLFGPGCIIDDLSDQNPLQAGFQANAFVLAVSDSVHDTLGLSAAARQGHTVTALDDGTVLIAGGDDPATIGTCPTFNPSPLNTLELFNPQTGFFTLLGVALNQARSTHTATKLADGSVLFLGGYDATGTVVNTGEIYDPATGTVTTIMPMTQARTQHSATLMADDRVFVVGGSELFNPCTAVASLAGAKKTVEVYDPATDMWTSGPDVPNVPDGIGGHGASLLANGQILITGGVEVLLLGGVLPVPEFVNECRRFDPTSGNWSAAAFMSNPRAFHGQVELPNGSVLVVGGVEQHPIIPLEVQTVATCERYDPIPNTWTPSPSLNGPRAYPNVLLTSDEIIAVGGLRAASASGAVTPETNIEVLPITLLPAWTVAQNTALPREVARAVLIDGGERVLVVGVGDNGVPAVDMTAEVYVR